MDQDAILLTLLAAGISHCADVFTDQGNILLSLLFMGLVGGLTHCTAMCGPFVLSQVEARLQTVPAARMREWHRLTGAAVFPYQMGRLTTYALLGTLGALFAGSLSSLSGLKWVSAALLAVAALLLVGYAVPRLKIALPGGQVAESWWASRVGRVARPLFRAPVGWRGYGLGVLLGFIPCGLLYGALLAAAATGDPVAGAFGMAAFAVGTMPSLMGLGLAGYMAGSQWKAQVARFAPALLLLNAGVLSYMAVTLVL